AIDRKRDALGVRRRRHGPDVHEGELRAEARGHRACQILGTLGGVAEVGREEDALEGAHDVRRGIRRARRDATRSIRMPSVIPTTNTTAPTSPLPALTI